MKPQIARGVLLTSILSIRIRSLPHFLQLPGTIFRFSHSVYIQLVFWIMVIVLSTLNFPHLNYNIWGNFEPFNFASFCLKLPRISLRWILLKCKWVIQLLVKRTVMSDRTSPLLGLCARGAGAIYGWDIVLCPWTQKPNSDSQCLPS